MVDTDNFNHADFLTTEAGLYVKVSFFHIVHGCNKVLLASMELRKALFE